MEEIFKEENTDEEYIILEKEVIVNGNSFICSLNNINSIVKINEKFIYNIMKIRYNTKTINQYDEEYTKFIKLYSEIVHNFNKNIEKIISKHFLKPSFMLDLDIYYDDISNKILNIITYEKKNLQLLGLKLNIMFKNKKRYTDELYSIYCHYINSIDMIKSELKFNKYTYELK